MTVILLMMVGAVLSVTRQSKYASSRHSGKVSALYAAESGINDAVARLNEDNAWAPTTPYTVKLPNGNSSYTIQFTASPTGDPDLSVNNLKGTGRVAGPRGPNTVPPAAIYLIVDGSAGDVERRLEVLIQSAPLGQLNSPLVSSGNMSFEGNVKVDGIQSFKTQRRILADVHSNRRGNFSDVIDWEHQPGERFEVNGKVSATSTATDAIDLGTNRGAIRVRSQENNAGRRAFPNLNIDNAVEDAATAPVFTPTVGVNVLTGGEHQFAGGTINGDLILEDTNLYVTGDLRVNGSISGTGSVFVLGDSTFSGAADVNVGEEGHIALYSKGHVTLEGFAGTEFLDSAGLGRDLQLVKDGIEGLQRTTRLGQYGAQAGPGITWGYDHSPADTWRRLLGQSTSAVPQGYTEADSNSLLRVANNLEAQREADPSKARTVNFLLSKLNRLRDITGPRNPNNIEVAPYLDNGDPISGLLDDVNDQTFTYRGRPLTRGQVDDIHRLMSADIQNYNFDALGTSYFKGVIYTNGAFYSKNEVEVVGGVYVERNADSPTAPLAAGSRNLAAGDIRLTGGSRFTYVKELLETPAGRNSASFVVPVTWLSPAK